MNKKKVYKEAKVFVTDNGYTVYLSNHEGEFDGKQGFKVCKTLDEVKKVFQSNLKPLID